LADAFSPAFILTGIISFDLFGLSNWGKRSAGRDASESSKIRYYLRTMVQNVPCGVEILWFSLGIGNVLSTAQISSLSVYRSLRTSPNLLHEHYIFFLVKLCVKPQDLVLRQV
jgi:hypothetical protein